LHRARQLRVALAIVFVAFIVRLGDEWLSFPTTGARESSIKVATWNLEEGSRPPLATATQIEGLGADVVALQELTPDDAEAIAADPVVAQSFPYRALNPGSGVTGLGLLSRYPIDRTTYDVDPARQAVMLTIEGRSVTVVNAHPLHGDVERIAGIPVGVDATRRNVDLAVIRDEIDALISEDRSVIVVGDFNTAPTEPAFSRLTSGLADAHRVASSGPGWTWRPSSLEWLGIGLVRIDLVLGGPGVSPAQTAIRCPQAGDHCILEAVLAIESQQGAPSDVQ
jgi:vancomycin resistance protein VanJ